MTVPPERLVNSLKIQRAERGITQEELAEMVGVTRKTINTIERALFIPSTVRALRLARVLREPVEELFRLEDSP